MSFSTNNNVSLLMAARVFDFNSRLVHSSLVRLATGQRINRGADHPAGLIASESLRSTLAALDAETRAMERTEFAANTADGALGEISDMLIEAEGLAVAAADDTLTTEERQAYQMELDSIMSSVNRIAGTTTFNGQHLLSGGAQLTAAGETLTLDSVHSGSLGETEIDGETYVLSAAGSGGALNLVDGNVEGAQAVIGAARAQVSAMRGEIGAFQANTISSGLNATRVAIENITTAESLIRDTDYFAETAELSRASLLRDSGRFTFTRALRAQRNVLALLGQG